MAAYIEDLSKINSKPTVKQHLAAIRMLFDYLVVGQVVAVNPASSVRGPRYSVKKGKTPVLMPDQAREFLDSIDTATIKGLRDRALIGVMLFSFARVGAVIDPAQPCSGAGSVEQRLAQGCLARSAFSQEADGSNVADVVNSHNALLDASS